MPDIFDASSHKTTEVEPEYVPEPLPEEYHTHQHGHTHEVAPATEMAEAVATPEISAPAPESADENAPSRATAERKCKHVDEYSQVMKNESRTTNPLQAFAPKPDNVFFDSQHSDERVILLLRQHPFTQFRWLLVALGLSFLPFLFSFFPFLAFLPARFQFAGLIGWYALVFSFILESFLMWFFNIYIITDERIIDVDFNSLIYKNISSAKLDNIEDVTATTGGAARSMFNYGTITIQTASANNQFEFTDVPQPAKVTSLLNELLIEEEREKLEGRVS